MTTENNIFMATADRVPTVLAANKRALEGKRKGKLTLELRKAFNKKQAYMAYKSCLNIIAEVS